MKFSSYFSSIYIEILNFRIFLIYCTLVIFGEKESLHPSRRKYNYNYVIQTFKNCDCTFFINTILHSRNSIFKLMQAKRQFKQNHFQENTKINGLQLLQFIIISYNN